MDERVIKFNEAVKNMSQENLDKKKIDELKEENLKLKKSITSEFLSISENHCWHDGVDLPSNSLGQVGDYYLQLPGCDIFKKLVDNHWERIGNIRGEAGEPGLNGSDGMNGTNGSDGMNGANGSDGIQGPPGINGSMWYDGSGTPSGEVGISNDRYLDLSNGDIYYKTDNWLRMGNIMGPRGPQGEIGATPSIEHLETIVNNKVLEVDGKIVQVDIKMTELTTAQENFTSFASSAEAAELERVNQEKDRREYFNGIKIGLTVTENDILEIMTGLW